MSDEAGRAARRDRRIARIVGLGGFVLRLLARTWRIRQVNRGPMQALRDAGHPIIFVLWHGNLLPLLWHHRDQGIAVLISEHGDGEIVARVALSLGFRTVRGSTSRGGARALLELTRVSRSGIDLAFTPDGPRGPARRFAPGALIVAQRAGVPLVPLYAHADRAWHLRSWDRFVIPKPFSRITVAYADPIHLAAGTPREAAAETDRMETAMAATVEAAGG